jgi:hypothetical protein
MLFFENNITPISFHAYATPTTLLPIIIICITPDPKHFLLNKLEEAKDDDETTNRFYSSFISTSICASVLLPFQRRCHRHR